MIRSTLQRVSSSSGARPVRPRWPAAALALLGSAVFGAAMPAAHASTDSERRLGDHLSYALPLGALAVELWRGDRAGAWQLTQSFVVTTGTTELLKRATNQTRPDGSNDKSFPSGHAARAFSAAAYVRQRHGFEAAWPLYVAATYVGHTRVQADRHRWRDVVGAAALAELSAHWLVEPFDGRLQVSAGPQSVQVQWRW
jgi:membrane-associated phospholipid phosphatase